MEDFIDALKKASNAMLVMSQKWEELNELDDQRVQGLKQWGEGFNVSLDEIPYILWSAVDELEGK